MINSPASRGTREAGTGARRLLLTLHWALPAATAVGAGLLFGAHPLAILAIAGASLVLRPVLTGPFARAVFVAFVLSPLLDPAMEILSWPTEV
jgi:hypothetical protein